jgi:hypothetical protein
MAKARAPGRLSLEDGELMPEGENLRLEFKTRANGGPTGGKQRDEQGERTGRERYHPSAQICHGDKRFRVLGRDKAAWTGRRNDAGAAVTWMFGIEQARAKLGRAYPTPAAAAEATAA